MADFLSDGRGTLERWVDQLDNTKALVVVLGAVGPGGGGGASSISTGTGMAVSLANVAAPANGVAFNTVTIHRDWAMEVIVTGNPTTLSVQLQGSLGGTQWANLGSPFTVPAGGLGSVMGAPAIQVRAVLVTLSGGVSPHVTVNVGGI